MEKPDRDNKKYTYYHKKANKKMFNNALYSADYKKWKEFNSNKNE